MPPSPGLGLRLPAVPRHVGGPAASRHGGCAAEGPGRAAVLAGGAASWRRRAKRWSGRSQGAIVMGIHIAYVFPSRWGAVRSYLEFIKQ